jgi:transcriptional regulator with XRE-family HTH domain
MTIGKRIQALRVERGITRTEFAKMLGVGYDTLYNWEHCGTTPHLRYIRAAAKLLDVDFDLLINGGQGL